MQQPPVDGVQKCEELKAKRNLLFQRFLLLRRCLHLAIDHSQVVVHETGLNLVSTHKSHSIGSRRL